MQEAINQFYKKEPIEQVHATIKESAPQVPVLTPPGQDFIQIDDIQKKVGVQ